MARSGGFQIQPYKVPHLLREEGIGREFEGFRPMRLQAEGAPDSRHGHVRQLGGLRHRTGAPVGGLGRCRFQGAGDHLFHSGVGDLTRGSGTRLIGQTFQPGGAKAFPPLADGRTAGPQLPRDRLVGKALRAAQYNARAQGQPLSRFRPPRPLLQFLTFLVRQLQFFLGASDRHAAKHTRAASLIQVNYVTPP